MCAKVSCVPDVVVVSVLHVPLVFSFLIVNVDGWRCSVRDGSFGNSDIAKACAADWSSQSEANGSCAS